jgi:hypothetical protein
MAYEKRTEFAKSLALEKDGRRERISGLVPPIAVLSFTRGFPPLLGFSARLKDSKEYLTG